MSLFSEFDLFRRSVHQLFSEFERDFLNDRYLLDTHFADYPMMQQAIIGTGAMDVDDNQNNQNNNDNNNATPSKPDTTPNNANNNNQTSDTNNATATGTTTKNNNAGTQLQSTRGNSGGALMNSRYPLSSSLFSSSLAPWSNHSLALRSFPASCKMDVIEKSDRYEVHAELAGIPKENIKIEINDGLLTLSGEHRIQKEEKTLNDNNNNNENKDNNNANNNNNTQQPQYHYRERSYSSVKRSLRLPENIDQEKIGAKFDNGLLEIYLPKKEKITPKTLNVQIA